MISVRRSRAALARWIADAILPFADGAAPRVVLGVPAEVSERGVAGGCTYAGFEGWAAGRAVLSALDARLPKVHPWRAAGGRLSVLNDAVLAGRGVRPPAGATWLSITLGFGPGGALVRGPEPLPRGASAPMTPMS